MDRVTLGAALWARRSLQAFLVFLLAVTGVAKLIDVSSFAAVLETYQVLPTRMLLPVALLVPLLELLLAGWLLSGRALERAALASALLHLSYAGWAGLALLRGVEVPNCGCFGAFLARPLNGWTLVEDFVMVAVSLTLAALAQPTPHQARAPRAALST